MPRDPRALLADALDAARSIDASSRSGPRWLPADELVRAAVERKLEVVGEALNRLSREEPELAARIPDIARSSDSAMSSPMVTTSWMTNRVGRDDDRPAGAHHEGRGDAR